MAKRKPRKRTTLRTKRPKAVEALEDPLHERTWTAFPHLPGNTQKHAFLLVLSGPQFGEIFPLAAGRELVIGRRDDCDVRLRDDGVSRRHATLTVVGEGAVVRDLRSANGTWVEGDRKREARLADGARVHLGGNTTLKFVWADELEARFQVRLAEGALQDPLTGLYNRRHFEERLGSELAACQRHGRPLSLLLCDVDHFKRINDDHGHLAGDETLKMVAFVLPGAAQGLLLAGDPPRRGPHDAPRQGLLIIPRTPEMLRASAASAGPAAPGPPGRPTVAGRRLRERSGCARTGRGGLRRGAAATPVPGT